MYGGWAKAVARLNQIKHQNTIPIDSYANDQSIESKSGAFLNDGRRRIDFILVYRVADSQINRGSKSVESEKCRRRAFFEENLMKEGLVLEKDEWTRPDQGSSDSSGVTIFVKVHGSFNTLCRYAEKLNIKVPLKLRDAFAAANVIGDQNPHKTVISKFFKWMREKSMELFGQLRSRSSSRSVAPPSITVHPTTITVSPKMEEKQKPPYVTHRFRRRHVNMYTGIEKTEDFFTPIQRIEIVWEILQKARNDEQDEKKRGIELLVENGVYECAFPNHDGSDHLDDIGQSNASGASDQNTSDRQILKRTWANWKCLSKPQPLHVIRRYYGEKVAFYFAFLGFYTKMLIYPGLFGLIIFFWTIVSHEESHVCDPNRDPGNRTMCPTCEPPYCGFTTFAEGCTNAKWNYHTDSPVTLALACFTVIWSAAFLKMWKRRESELAYDWDTYDMQEHEETFLRPEYEQLAPNRRPNPVTKELEPYVPRRLRLLRSALSTFITLMMLCAVGVTLVCLVMVRIALYGTFKKAGFVYYVELGRWSIHALIFITVVVFDYVYDRVARRLTSLECPRTSSSWLSSFLWKVFIFELLNDFIPIGYVAWVKGKTMKTPIDMTWYSEMCEGGGCMGEVMEIVAVLLVARLVIGNSIEIGLPFMKRIYAKTFRLRNKNDQADQAADRSRIWRQDYLLGELELDGVSEEYMEMIVQFSFLSLFISALPVAPFLCLVNNILEIRIDAINLNASHRRPLPVRVPGIGIWYDFFNVVTKLAVFCNAGLIAFTSQTVQRLHYNYNRGKYDTPIHSYEEASLSRLRQSDFTEKLKLAQHELPTNISECWYSDYRMDVEPFAPTSEWWQMMCCRVATFGLFVLASFIFQWFINLVVDDVPAHVRLKILRRRYVVAKATEAGGAYDLWLSKAVRRESTFPQVAALSSPRTSSKQSTNTVCPVIETNEETEENIELPSTSTRVMVKQWKKVTFGVREHVDHAVSMNATRAQKTLDAVDIEEDDL